MASMSPPRDNIPTVNKHLAQVRKLAQCHHADLALLPSEIERTNRLAELNVLDQIERLAQLPVISAASQDITLHGWIFSLQDGLLKVLHSSEKEHLYKETI
jgi:carbonic anhydrase